MTAVGDRIGGGRFGHAISEPHVLKFVETKLIQVRRVMSRGINDLSIGSLSFFMVVRLQQSGPPCKTPTNILSSFHVLNKFVKKQILVISGKD